MGVVSMILLAVVPFLLLNFLPEHEVKAIQITFADPPGNNNAGPSYQSDRNDVATPPPNDGSLAKNQSEMVARNAELAHMFGEQATEHDMMVIVCNGLQTIIEDCEEIPKFRDYMRQNRPSFRLPNKRRRRFASGFGSSFGSHPSFNSFNSFNNFDPWPNTLTNNINSFGSHSLTGGSLTNTGNALICPSLQDQSQIYQLNPDSMGYPAADIGNELILDPIIQNCLTREIVLEGDPPQLLFEDFRLTANATCPFTQLRLWNYQSQAVGALCWIMQNFQENVLYRVCSERFCQNCKNKRQIGFGSTIDDRLSQKLCITDYRTESVWAFCPSLTPGQRIVRDRIIVPFACNCQSVRCELIPQW